MPNAKEDEESLSGLHEQRGDPMKTWNLTKMVWSADYATNIPFSDWRNERAKTKPCISLSRIEITSQPNGVGCGKILLNGKPKSVLCAEDRLTVEQRLQGLQVNDLMLFWNTTCIFGEFAFKLQKNEHFTDRAINIAKQIALSLGIYGKILEEYLTRFQVSQETRVLVDMEWIDFADYLRKRHGLPHPIRGNNLRETY